jgi:hypothetical protein
MLEEQLRNLPNEIAFFLNKLSKIHLSLNGDIFRTIEKNVTSKRKVGSFDLELLRVETKTWISISAQCSMEGVQEESRKEFVDYKPLVTLALPLNSQDIVNTKASGKLFAFLPTEINPSLPFLINADFILTASRESLNFANPWNQRLMAFAANLLAEGLEFLIPHFAKTFRTDEWMNLYLMVPDAPVSASSNMYAEMGVFRRSAQKVLVRKKIVITEDGKTPETPQVCRIASLLTCQLMKGSKPVAMKDISLVDHRFLARPNIIAALNHNLGVEYFSFMWLNCMQDVQWVRSHVDDDEWYANLLEEMYKQKIPIQNLHLLLPMEGNPPFADENLAPFEVYFRFDDNVMEHVHWGSMPRCLRKSLVKLLEKNGVLAQVKEYLITQVRISERFDLSRFATTLSRKLADEANSISSEEQKEEYIAKSKFLLELQLKNPYRKILIPFPIATKGGFRAWDRVLLPEVEDLLKILNDGWRSFFDQIQKDIIHPSYAQNPAFVVSIFKDIFQSSGYPPLLYEAHTKRLPVFPFMERKSELVEFAFAFVD